MNLISIWNYKVSFQASSTGCNPILRSLNSIITWHCFREFSFQAKDIFDRFSKIESLKPEQNQLGESFKLTNLCSWTSKFDRWNIWSRYQLTREWDETIYQAAPVLYPSIMCGAPQRCLQFPSDSFRSVLLFSVSALPCNQF